MQSNQGKVRSVYGSGGYYDADSQELAKYSGYAIPAEDGSGVIYVGTTEENPWWFKCCPVFVCAWVVFSTVPACARWSKHSRSGP